MLIDGGVVSGTVSCALDLPEVRDQFRLKCVIAVDQIVQLSQESIVGNALQRRHGR